jgi:hypothetical protein
MSYGGWKAKQTLVSKQQDINQGPKEMSHQARQDTRYRGISSADNHMKEAKRLQIVLFQLCRSLWKAKLRRQYEGQWLAALGGRNGWKGEARGFVCHCREEYKSLYVHYSATLTVWHHSVISQCDCDLTIWDVSTSQMSPSPSQPCTAASSRCPDDRLRTVEWFSRPVYLKSCSDPTLRKPWSPLNIWPHRARHFMTCMDCEWKHRRHIPTETRCQTTDSHTSITLVSITMCYHSL